MPKKLIHGLTHRELVKIALRWLRNTEKCSVVICEMRSQHEEPDAIGWKSATSTLVECKATRSDFLADIRRKRNVKMEDVTVKFGMGTFRYYMAPEGLIKVNELPRGWGLLEVLFSGRVMRRKRSARFILPPLWMRNELGLALSALRRYQDQERKRCDA